MKRIHFAVMFLMCVNLWSCSKGNDSSTILDATGKHPALWAAASTGGMHPAAYFTNPGSCAECHGSDLIKEQSGGTVNVSCFSASRSGISCHPGGPSNHQVGFANPNLHGVNAKSAAVGSLGMGFCKNCHGNDFRGAGSTSKDCIACHRLTTPATNAPHSPAPWRGGARTHVTTDSSNAAVCSGCHSGGANSTLKPSPAAPAGTTPGCFNSTLCHGVTGHASDPQPWVAAANHGARAKINLGTCQTCHATPSSGINPRFNLAKTAMAAGCETCHKPNTSHPTPWITGRVGTPDNVANTTSHTTVGVISMNTDCVLCHGTALNGVAGGGTAPSCMSATAIGGISCHATSPVSNPTGCSSCHGNPPATNKHGAHFSNIPNLACAACHNNYGTGASTHADGTVNVAISSTYLAKTGGTATFNADGTCSNVSCHGGKQSPAWTTAGTFDITVCANCHAYGTAQYNSYNSGRHKTHDDSGITCLQCHDTTKLGSNSNHFVHLETTTMEGPASATIGGGSTKVANYLNRSCTPTDTRDFPTGPCHANRTW